MLQLRAMKGLGLGVGIGVQGLGLRVEGLEFRVQGYRLGCGGLQIRGTFVGVPLIWVTILWSL